MEVYGTLSFSSFFCILDLRSSLDRALAARWEYTDLITGHFDLRVCVNHFPLTRESVFFSSLLRYTVCICVHLFLASDEQSPSAWGDDLHLVVRCAGALQRGFQDFVWYCQTTMRWPRMPWESHGNGAWKFCRCCTVKFLCIKKKTISRLPPYCSWLMILRSYTTLHIGCRNP